MNSMIYGYDNKRRCIDKKSPENSSRLFCGPDGTRTRDPMRDRHVF